MFTVQTGMDSIVTLHTLCNLHAGSLAFLSFAIPALSTIIYYDNMATHT